MDYTADAQEMGKNVGDDLAEGKTTLPLLYAMKHGTKEQSDLIKEAIEVGNGMDNLEKILKAMEETGSLHYTQAQAEIEADKAIQALSIIPASKQKQALIALAHIAANRSH
jgi:octaprenyl-diphosphate synthase